MEEKKLVHMTHEGPGRIEEKSRDSWKACFVQSESRCSQWIRIIFQARAELSSVGRRKSAF